MRDPHPLAASAGGGLDHDGIADLVGDLHRMLCVLDNAEMARHCRNLRLRGGLFRFDLVAHGGDRAGVGSDENDTGLTKRARKGFALGQKPVAGMHRLRAGLAAGLDDLLHHQIAFGGGRRPDQNGVIGHFDVERVAVGLGIDRDRLYSHAPGSLDDPAGDLAAICDQGSFEHGFLVCTLWAGASPAIWHAGTEVTIPSYSKTERRQRSSPVFWSDFSNGGAITAYSGLVPFPAMSGIAEGGNRCLVPISASSPIPFLRPLDNWS